MATARLVVLPQCGSARCSARTTRSAGCSSRAWCRSCTGSKLPLDPDPRTIRWLPRSAVASGKLSGHVSQAKAAGTRLTRAVQCSARHAAERALGRTMRRKPAGRSWRRSTRTRGCSRWLQPTGTRWNAQQRVGTCACTGQSRGSTARRRVSSEPQGPSLTPLYAEPCSCSLCLITSSGVTCTRQANKRSGSHCQSRSPSLPPAQGPVRACMRSR